VSNASANELKPFIDVSSEKTTKSPEPGAASILDVIINESYLVAAATVSILASVPVAEACTPSHHDSDGK